jgi:hypothetical protein
MIAEVVGTRRFPSSPLDRQGVGVDKTAFFIPARVEFPAGVFEDFEFLYDDPITVMAIYFPGLL